MIEQPVISRSLVGSAAWPHSKFRLTVEKLKASGFKLMLAPEETVARFATYCDYVERHGRWHTKTAMQEGILNAKHVHQSVKNHRKLLPLHYWRTTWPSVDVTPREDKSGTKTFEALKSEMAALNKRMAMLETSVSAQATKVSSVIESFRQHGQRFLSVEQRLDNSDESVSALVRGLSTKPRRKYLARFRKELWRRLRVLIKGGK